MRTFCDFCRIIFVSFEFLFLLASVSAVWVWPAFFSFAGDALKTQPEVLKWLPVVPLALCAGAFQLAWKLTTPLSDSNRELLEWPGYCRLKLRRNFSMFLSAAIAITVVVAWIFSPHIDVIWFGFSYVTCIGLALINVGCMSVAALTLREIMEK